MFVYVGTCSSVCVHVQLTVSEPQGRRPQHTRHRRRGHRPAVTEWIRVSGYGTDRLRNQVRVCGYGIRVSGYGMESGSAVTEWNQGQRLRNEIGMGNYGGHDYAEISVNMLTSMGAARITVCACR